MQIISIFIIRLTSKEKAQKTIVIVHRIFNLKYHFLTKPYLLPHGK